ncbi:glycosyltransferase family 90 protein [Sphaerobolus stellatus SS14]|uniref:Glycosyltransferase family 90 protein n=1 Tax=Sphaerobolus stellatus (strain SS14) TaxID=990650 RepID=A0A0C9UUY8_SPHS4|nr:glycosyltransferase family 90 protein [Sphaerobolus stellatus SS14]
MPFSNIKPRRSNRPQLIGLVFGVLLFILWCRSTDKEDLDSLSPAPVEQEKAIEKDPWSYSYEFRKDGLVEVDMEKQHPLLLLIRNAEGQWRDMYRRQSKTLEAAVAEYKRRNGYAPPVGFDAWWAFVQKHNVKLVDEFDQINRDVTPYLALSPQMFRERVDDPALSNPDRSWHFAIKNSNFDRTGPRWWFGNERGLASLLMGFSRALPDLVMHGPEYVRGDDWIGEDYRKAAVEKVKNGSYFTHEELAHYESVDRNPRRDISNICEDTDPVLQHQQPYSSNPKFVADPLAYVSPCESSRIHNSHPLIYQPHARRPHLTPYFVFAKQPPGSGFLVPTNTWELYDSALQPPRKWSDRDNKLYWRGIVTGWNWYKGLQSLRASEGIHLSWRDGARPKLSLMFSEKVDPGFQVDVLVEKGLGGNGTGLMLKKYNVRKLNEKWMDIGLIGEAIQCDKEEGTCAEMERAPMWKRERDLITEANKKFVVELDGNDWSEQFQRKLAAGNVVLRSTAYPEWNDDWLIPYYHYIPIQSNYTDIYNIMSFFVGDPEHGQGSHDDLAQRISEHATEFANKHWRWVDMQAYLFRLMLEYVRLLSDDRDAASFQMA